ncbi:MBG domain-containing protein, partial [Brotaphodocola catenula]
MRKKKLWKQKCAMGLAVAVTATSVPTPALAGKAEVPVANETQVEGEDTESESGDVATSSDADVVDDTKKQEDKKEKEEKVSKATASDAEENDGEGDLIDDVTVPDKEQKATSSDADLEEPAEEELLPANQIQLSAQAGQNLNQGATIDVWDGMTEEELKEELKREVWGGVDADFPDTWYYHASATTLGRQTTDWVELGGETLNKKLRLSVQSVTYSSLMDVAVSGSATSFEIGIGAARTTKTYAGKEYVETSIADGEYATVKIRKEIKVAYTEPDETENHGTLVGEKTAKLRQKFTFKITPQVGWVPEVSVSNASASSIDVSVIRDGDQYVYTIAGDDITEDLEVKISYQADRANVETITLDSNTRDNFTVKYGSSEVTGDAFDINKTAREISIKAKDGYFLASVNGNTDLSEDDFSNDGWMTYTIADGESTISVETLKAEFVTNANPWLAWETDDSVDEDTAGKVLDAVLDWTKTLPGETVISKDQVTVEYLMGTGAATGSKSYKELTYEIKGADSYLYKGAHNFGADTETVRITWNGSKRYPKLELELELALRPDRSNKDIVTIKTATRDAIQIQYKDATVTDDELLLDKDNHEIKISAKDGYYLENVDGTMLGDSDFTAAHVYEYTVPDGATELSVSVKKMSFEAKQDPTLNWYEGKEIDESTAQKIIEAVVDWTGTVPDESVIDKEDLKVEYAASDMPESSLYSPYKSLDHDPGVNFLEHEFGDKTSEKIRITWNGTNQYRKMVLEVTLNLEDTRLETSVTLNSGVKVTYVPEDQEETFKRAVYEQVISKVDPLAEKPAYEKFKIVNNTKTLLTPDYNVGTKEVQVTYLGDDTYKSSKATVQVEIVKAKSSIRVKQLYAITYGQEIPGEYIVTNPEGLKVLAIYAGVNSDFDGTIMFNVPKITVAGMDVDLESIIRTIFPDGASISDVLEFLNSDASQTVLKLLEQAGIDTSSFIQALETISKYLPDSVTSLRVQFGTPNRAGMYATVAIVADQNYESSVGVGSLIIKPETQDVRLVWKNNVTTIAFNDRPATDEEAEKLFEAGIYVSDQEQVNPTTEVRYSYKGTSLAGVYYDMATPVLDPGTYTQTAYIRNGDQLAWPISREYTVELSDSQIRFDDLDEDGTKTVFYNGQPQGLTAQLYYGKDFDQKCENAELHYTYNGSYTVPTDAGIYEVVAGFNGDGWHKIAPHVTAILIINKVTPQIAITPAEYTYDGQAHSAEYQVTGIDGEELAGVEATVTYTNMETGATSQDAPTEVGTYHVTVTVKDSKNYGANSQTAEQALVIKKAELQGTSVEITDLEHVYDGNVHKASVSVTGVADEQIDDYTVTYLDEAGEVVENP